ncbi:hypothetical protein HK405_000463, partial [Cladochytrium tenue]
MAAVVFDPQLSLACFGSTAANALGTEIKLKPLTIFVYANALFECGGKVHRTYGKCAEWTALDAYVNSVRLDDERHYNDLK